VPFSDCSYRQEIDWAPSFNRDLKGTLMLMPDYQRVRSYRERALTAEAGGVRERPGFSFDNRLRWYGLVHDDTLRRARYGNDFSLVDFSARFTQTRHLDGMFDVSLRECGGWARQKNVSGSVPAAPPDSSWYLQLTPGAAWLAGARGRVEADYTISWVTVPGDHDYRIASGFASGISHVINVFGDVKIGKYFMLNASYRGEIFGRRRGAPPQPGRHAMSLEVRAYL
jgi:hypothetical protein